MLFRMHNQLRVVFAGTPDNAASSLETLHQSGVNIVGVLTRLDSHVGRSREVKQSAVSDMATRLGIRVFKTNKIDDSARQWLRSVSPDIGVVVAYGSILRNEELGIPRLGWLNLHFSLLPDFRGAAPVQHAILQGTNKTGVSVFRLDEGVDTGPLVAQEVVPIDETDFALSLLKKLSVVGNELLATVIADCELMLDSAVPQQSIGNETIASKPSRELAKLDFTLDATTQFNKVRAMNPEPMAWFEYKDSPIRVIQSRVLHSTEFEIAIAQLIDKELVVGCQGGALVLESIQPAGKNPMSGSDWFRGLRVEKLKIS
jgi:methionyl-tRNA formyltransferase